MRPAARVALMVGAVLAPALAGCLGAQTGPQVLTYELTHVASGTTATLDLVHVQDGLVGAPVGTDLRLPLIVHLPPMGDIADDGSFEMHDLRFHPIQWPAEAGASWTTTWMHGETLEARIERVTDGIAVVHMEGDGVTVDLGYDVDGRHIVDMDVPGYARLRLVGQDRGFSGDVVVPHDQDLVFYHGRTQGGLSYPDGAAAGPAGQIEVPPHDAVAFALIMRDRGIEDTVPPGYYRITTTAPDGARFTQDLAASALDDYEIALYLHDGPEGTWTFEAVAAGHGYALLEGIGFDRVTVRLPAGCAMAGAHALVPAC